MPSAAAIKAATAVSAVGRTHALDGDDAPVSSDSTRDVKALIKTMILGLKTVLWCLTNYAKNRKDKDKVDESQRPAGYDPSIHILPVKPIMTRNERALVSDFFKGGLNCCRLYNSALGTRGPEAKEILDHFASAFTVLDAHNMRDCVGPHMALLFDGVLSDVTLLAVPQLLLANSNASATFADVLLKFLISRLDDLGAADPSTAAAATPTAAEAAKKKAAAAAQSAEKPGTDTSPSYRASILLRLFKIVFGSVTLFADNERVLLPHLRALVLSCLRHTTRARRPVGYVKEDAPSAAAAATPTTRRLCCCARRDYHCYCSSTTTDSPSAPFLFSGTSCSSGPSSVP